VLRRALVAGVVAVGLIAAAPAQATTPPRLTGEAFHEDLPTITSLKCVQPNHFEWSSTGEATGPYPGSYVETGRLESNGALTAEFVIFSSVGIVKGTKTGFTGYGCGGGTDCNSAAECDDEGASFNTPPLGQDDRNVYEATITIPGGGTFSDTGLFATRFYHSEDHNSPFDGFDETFRSGLDTVEFTGPKTLESCRDGGYSSFGFPDAASCKQFARARAREACTFEKIAHGTAAFRTKYGEPAMYNCVHARIGF
jgi:hypothetical protein